MPMSFYRALLTSLEPGQYDCQVTVLDPEGQKTAFWQDKVQIVQ